MQQIPFYEHCVRMVHEGNFGWDWLTDLDITAVHEPADGSVTFPEISAQDWSQTSSEPHGEFDFVHYARISAPRPLPPATGDAVADH